MDNKKLWTIKGIAIFLLIAYVILSCFPCGMKINRGTGAQASAQSAFSWALLIAAALQILFIFLNRPILQMFAGLYAAFASVAMPARVYLQNLIHDNIYYFRAPDGGGVNYRYVMTGLGWVVTGLACTLIVLDIVLAVVMHRQKKRCAQQPDVIIGG